MIFTILPTILVAFHVLCKLPHSNSNAYSIYGAHSFGKTHRKLELFGNGIRDEKQQLFIFFFLLLDEEIVVTLGDTKTHYHVGFSMFSI